MERAIGAAPQPFRLALTILRETGMRAGKVLALNLGDIALDPGREALHVRDPKNRTEGMVVLGPTATPKSLRALRAQLRERKGEPAHTPLFRSNRGTRLSYDALHYQWVQACTAAGIADKAGKPRFTLHQLRCSLREAERLLYPNATSGLAWEQLHEDMRARRIRTYRVGIGQNMRTFASRADVEALASARAAS